ncbi:hypothetical protein [Dickeya undicola]|uniref:GIY-YIG nuclease family protein n=1 Tax=Dickeya undicola TaxID=1577887 RepID=A0A3N0FWS8_9GAMM|nr:hypothetical protein [Dickeya undicola]RNM04634.1 hypothetical protein EF878_14550 [Dickeya undicola]
MTPFYTVKLTLIENKKGKTLETQLRKIININEFPDAIGAYIIRYENHCISRLNGKSTILKIGCTTKSFKNRFKNYNHQSDITIPGWNLYEILRTRTQKTNARVMYFLAHLSQGDNILIDFYLSDTEKKPQDLEQLLIKEYIEQHWELPPLNFGMK